MHAFCGSKVRVCASTHKVQWSGILHRGVSKSCLEIPTGGRELLGALFLLFFRSMVDVLGDGGWEGGAVTFLHAVAVVERIELCRDVVWKLLGSV